MGRDLEQAEDIVAVVGLGNPGSHYEDTRHNLGFRVVENLAKAFDAILQERKFRASWGTCEVQGRKVRLIKPLTYMNRSGEAVSDIVRYFGIPINQMLVVHDDLDLPPGRIRIARHGGAGGHKGVLSIIQLLSSQDFPRLKLGIGKPAHGEPVESYVLQHPYPEEAHTIDEMVSRGSKAAETVLLSGLNNAMNLYNRADSVEESQ